MQVAPHQITVRQSSDILAVGDQNIANAVQFIVKNAHRPIGVLDLLCQVPLSRRTLEQRFQSVLGCTPAEKIRHVRIQLAQQKLVDTNDSIESIAQRCGFSGDNQMVAVFRRVLGITPRQYRQRYRAGATLRRA